MTWQTLCLALLWTSNDRLLYKTTYRVAQKTGTLCFICLNLVKYWLMFKLFQCQNQENICNNNATKDPTTSQVRRYNTFWNVSVLKATIENETTSVTTHVESASSSSKVDTLNIWFSNCRMWQLFQIVTETIKRCYLFPVVNFLDVIEVLFFSIVAFKT